LDLTLGQIVYSKAGRDAGRAFVVIRIEDAGYVLIADGDLRKVEKPKKKKIRHVEVTGTIIDSLNEKLRTKQRITNAEIRNILFASGIGAANMEGSNITDNS